MEDISGIANPNFTPDRAIFSFPYNAGLENKYMFAMTTKMNKNELFPNNDTFLQIKPNGEEHFTAFKPYMVNEDEIFAAPIGGNFGIYANSPNKDLAWEFIKFMLSEESIDPKNIPANTTVMTANKKVNDLLMDEEINYILNHYMKTNIADLSGEDKLAVEVVKNQIDEDLSRPMRFPYLVAIPASSEVFEKYRNNLISAEQVAMELHNAAELKLMELQ